ERADQLVLQVCVADVEAESLHVGARRRRAETGPAERAPEVPLLSGVTETCELRVQAARAEALQEPSDALGTTDRHDRDSFGREVSAQALRQRLECDLIARSFDHDDRTRFEIVHMDVLAEARARRERCEDPIMREWPF